MPNSHLANLKDSNEINEKELERQQAFLKKMRQSETMIQDPEIRSTILGPSASRLFDLYDKLLNSYRQYVMESEKRK